MFTSQETTFSADFRQNRTSTGVWKTIAIIAGILFVIGIILWFTIVPGIIEKIFDDICGNMIDPDTGEILQRPCDALSEVTPLENAVLFYSTVSLGISPVFMFPWSYQNRQRWMFKILAAGIILWYMMLLGVLILAVLGA